MLFSKWGEAISEMFGMRVKTDVAFGRTEIIRLAFVLAAVRRGIDVHFLPADRIVKQLRIADTEILRVLAT